MTTTSPAKEVGAVCGSSRNDTIFAAVRPLLERSARSLGAGLIAAVVVAVTVVPAGAQTLKLSAADLSNSASLAASMPALATRALGVYREHDRRDSLDNVFRLELVAGRYDEAARSIAALHLVRTGAAIGKVTVQDRATNVQYDVYARAKLLERAGRPWPDALGVTFHQTFARLDDRTAALVVREFTPDTSSMHAALQRRLAGLKSNAQLPVDTAVALIRDYQMLNTYRALAPFARALVAEDDALRYVIDRNIRVTSADGATVCVMVVRQRIAPARTPTRLPALLNFTIYADPVTTMNEARRTASNGYAGVEGFTRGKACSPDTPVPYEHDGDDADAVINWISKQPWSDGRVGMYGGSYEGFTQWAAAKHLPAALKAMMPSVSAAPGIDVPMEGNVFQTFVYYWPFYTTNNKTLDDAPYQDRGRWWRMQREWYVSGRPYRDLDKIDGTPNPIFDRWLGHPSYDAYWWDMIPHGEEFSRINIPILTTTGYYDDGQIGALYYLLEHYRHNPTAEHYLVIGPYDHVRGQRGTTSSLGDEFSVLDGYTIDPVAHIDLGELRYAWFDHIFKGAPTPALLADRINYEVMGSNQWKHAESLGALSNQHLALHLSSALSAGGRYSLTADSAAAAGAAPTLQRIDLADRSDIERSFSNGIVQKTFDTWNSVAFVSDPMPVATEISGLFSGRLDVTTNKRDFDFNVSLYELTPTGEYVALSFYMARASYVRDRSRRQLLVPATPGHLNFTSGRMTSRKFQAGSRLIVQISIIRQPGAQINYGTAGDVSDETIADAGDPLVVRWLGTSVIDVPVWRQ
ncbi:MAG: CocE/NonD family hydrolase [Gemmatimonadaceae bacterium]